jgi:transcriptional regulator with XRE-family HTH domain
MNKDQKLGQQLKTYRLERDWTQEDLAKHLGVSRRLIIRLENGKGNILDLTRAKIERKLGLKSPLAAA